MREAGKEPFPKFYTDSKQEGQVSSQSNYSHMLCTFLFVVVVVVVVVVVLEVGGGLAEPDEEGEEDLG